MPDPLLLYGATGFTGRLILESALALGVRPVLGGRDAAKLAALADPLGLPWRAASLADAAQLDAALAGVRVVLHAAGPFSQTAVPMVVCLPARRRTLPRHHRRDPGDRERWRTAIATPGNAASCSCRASASTSCRPTASPPTSPRVWSMRRRSASASPALPSRPAARRATLAEHAGIGVNIRRGGVITPVPPGALRQRFDFGDGPRDCCNVSWGDVAAAYYTTGIPDIAVYFEATPTIEAMLLASRTLGWMLRSGPWQAWLKAHAALLPEGPSEAERSPREMVIVAEASDAAGRIARARLHTPEAYTFTGLAAPAIARRVLRGDSNRASRHRAGCTARTSCSDSPACGERI